MSRALAVAISVGLVLPAAACHPSGSDANGAARDPNLERDRTVISERGFRDSNLTIGSAPTEVGEKGARAGRTLGPFALGMTVEDVRAVARGNSMTGATSGGYTEAWCSAATSTSAPRTVLAPSSLSLSENIPSGLYISYSIDFAPKDGRLVAASIERFAGKAKRIGRDLRAESEKTGTIEGYSACALLAKEDAALAGWDHMENLELRDALGPPKLDRNRLPPAVRAALDRWERETTIPCDQRMSDCPYLDPAFDGWWEKDGRLVISYSLHLGGEAASTRDFMVVANPDGSFAWTGTPQEFAAHGLEGRRRTALQAGGR